jgi:sigma-E factor negative regulatory protein RseA
MKQYVSALMDDELEADEIGQAIDALSQNPELYELWNTYHLIGDILRQNPSYPVGFEAKVMARLRKETVLPFPAPRPARSAVRFVLPLAAALMGMAAVAWVALSLNEPAPAEFAAKSPQPAFRQSAAALAQSPPPGALKDKEYLLAHQAHSPSGSLGGGAPYVRTVSEVRQVGRP